jgi:hypothetical protein
MLPVPSGAQETPAPGDSSAAAPTIVVYERPADEETPEELGERVWAQPEHLHPIYTRVDREGKALSLDFLPSYDRVDELSLRFTQSFEHRKRLYPRLRIQEIYSTGRNRWLYALAFSQPIFRREILTFAATFHDDTAVFTDLEDRVGATENTLAALFFREDFRHYFAREGLSLSLGHRPVAGFSATATYTDEDQNPLGRNTNGSVFRPRGSFRENAAADAGRLRSWSFEAGYASPPRRLAPGLLQRHRLLYEIAGHDAGGRFEFERWVAESLVKLKVAPDQELMLQLRAGGRIAGFLPAQRQFYLGGIGTLRGHAFGSLRGDRMLLANLEYGFDLMHGFQGVLFHDVGTAWVHPRELGRVRPELDAGLGVRNRTARFRVDLARDLRANRAPIVVTVRIAQPF